VTTTDAPTLVDLELLTDLRRFGAADVTACFTCGTCTATCPLSDNDATFPRQLIRYAQVGLKDQLVSSKELWTCYHCGECSQSCPTQADPAEFMATARRYAVASYEPTGLARLLATRPVLGSVTAVAIAAFFAVFMYGDHGPRETDRLDLFRFIPDRFIHWTGIGVMVVMALAGLTGLVRMARAVARREHVRLRDLVAGRAAVRRTLRAAWSAIAVESLGQRRYRTDSRDEAPPEPLYRRRWLVHALTIWGFLGLLVATGLDWGLAVLGIKQTGTPVPVWYPSRLIGTVAGLSLLYGVTMFMIARARRAGIPYQTSTAGDWLLLVLLWITGFSGFLIEIALYLPTASGWGYWVFLFHVAAALELIILVPFMKFAHAIYRPLALFFYALAKSRRS
jgi:quinone-modifying oxidoreductase, subunit QmoC